tara:strand:- start:472 stop:1677 length:1206 start_codon:yes stop_codon:yes gene_type:complete
MKQKKIISYAKQTINSDDIQEVKKALKGDFLTGGVHVKGFEESLKSILGARYCSVCSSGTAALHLSTLALGIGTKDIVLTSPITFLASANSVIYTGANIDFVDIENDSNNLNPNLLEDKIKYYRNKNKKISLVIAVDYGGFPCNWKSLRYLANKYDFRLINDNCHALGSKYFNKHNYAVKYADLVTLSFHPTKNITTGEGGAVLTNNKDIDNKIQIFRNHGINNFNKEKKIKFKGLWHYSMTHLGYNYRITDFQCALGINQLKKLDKFIKKRNIIASYYDKSFKNFDNLITPIKNKNIYNSYHLYPLKINFKSMIEKKMFFKYLYGYNVKLQVHYIPIFLQPYYKNILNKKTKDYPVSYNFYKKAVSLPIYPLLNLNEQNYVIRLIKRYFKKPQLIKNKNK